MVNLDAADQKQLLDILLTLPILSSERGRESVLVSASLQKIRPHLDVTGAPAVAIPLMLQVLCSFGRLTHEQEALGRLLNTLKSYIGIDQQETLDHIIQKYSLMTPVVRAHAHVDWVAADAPVR